MNKIGRNFYNEIAEKLRRKEDLTNEDFFKIFYLTIMYGKKKWKDILRKNGTTESFKY